MAQRKKIEGRNEHLTDKHITSEERTREELKDSAVNWAMSLAHIYKSVIEGRWTTEERTLMKKHGEHTCVQSASAAVTTAVTAAHHHQRAVWCLQRKKDICGIYIELIV